VRSVLRLQRAAGGVLIREPPGPPLSSRMGPKTGQRECAARVSAARYTRRREAVRANWHACHAKKHPCRQRPVLIRRRCGRTPSAISARVFSGPGRVARLNWLDGPARDALTHFLRQPFSCPPVGRSPKRGEKVLFFQASDRRPDPPRLSRIKRARSGHIEPRWARQAPSAVCSAVRPTAILSPKLRRADSPASSDISVSPSTARKTAHESLVQLKAF